MQFSRRDFLGTSVAMAGSLAWPTHATAGEIAEIRVAVIGVRTQGWWGHVNQIPQNVVALCDVDHQVLQNRGKEFESKYGRKLALETDYRRLLERQDIDAVSIATPNHTHALITIAAAEAGKHVYVEKPIAHNIWEGRQMIGAARRYDTIIQCGTQSRSSDSLKDAVEYVRGGHLGKIRYALGTCYKPRMSIGKLAEPLQIPASIDYDLWCGPATKEPLYRPQLHYDWHWMFNTGNGDLGNQGIHQMDIARWFLGEYQLPPRALSLGGRFGYDDAGDTPNTQVVYLDYPAAPLIFEVRGLPRCSSALDPKVWPNSMDRYRGAQVGVVVQCEGGHILVPSYTEAIAFDLAGLEIKRWKTKGNSHHKNWLQSIAANDPSLLNASVHEGHISSALCHVGNISYRLGEPRPAAEILDEVSGNELLTNSTDRMLSHLLANDVATDAAESMVKLGPWLEVDPGTEQFANNAANALRKREGRAPYLIPELEVAAVASSS